MQWVLITAETDWSQEIEVLCQLFAHGLEVLHLRKPYKDRIQMQSFIESIPNKYHSRLVLHSYPELVANYPVRGLHINKRLQHIPEDTLFKNISYSASIHALEEISDIDHRIQYLFLSPIFDSISKPNYHSHFTDKNQLSKQIQTFKIKYSHRLKLFALGGVDLHRISEIKELGFDGFACMGAVWQKTNNLKEIDYLHRYIQLQQACNET